MSAEAIRQVVAARMNAQWATSNPVAPVPPIEWPNKDITPTPNTPYVRIDIANGDETQTGVAGSTQGAYMKTGIVSIRCFVPKDSGMKQAYLLGDHAAKIFRGYSASGIYFKSSSVSELPVESSDPWAGVIVRCVFDRHALETYL